MSGRRSFRDPVSGVLRAHGFTTASEPGAVSQPEADDFALEPGRWRWDGSAWVPAAAPAPTDVEVGALLDDDVNVKALLLWQLDRVNEIRARPTVGLPPVTEAEARRGLIEKRKAIHVAQQVSVRFGRPQPK